MVACPDARRGHRLLCVLLTSDGVHGRQPWVELQINPQFKPGADDGIGPEEDHGAVTTTDYLINAIFVLVVLQAPSGSWTAAASSSPRPRLLRTLR